MRPAGQVAIACAVLAVCLGYYSEIRQVSDQFSMVTGLLGLIAIGAGVIWWRQSREDPRVPRR